MGVQRLSANESTMRRDNRYMWAGVGIVLLYIFYQRGNSSNSTSPRARPQRAASAATQPRETHRPATHRPRTTRRRTKPAPATEFSFVFQTTKGNMTFLAHRDWAPLGVEQLHKMITSGFFTGGDPNGPDPEGGIGMFRCVPQFVVQFGIHGNPATAREWGRRVIKDDEVKHTNAKGTLTFAAAGPNTRTTQLFINLKDNAFLDKMKFATLAECTKGCDVLDRIEMKFAEKPNQGAIQQQGNKYLKANFPGLDYIIGATIM